MGPLSRRSALRVAGLGIGATVGGCLGGRAADTSIEYEVRQFGATPVEPTWREDDASGHVELYDSAETARKHLPFDRVSDERREELEAFVEDTDFADSRLLYVASVGPDACYDEIEVRELALADGAFDGTVAAVDTSEDDQACAQAITFPSALVRVTVDGDPPDRATITVVDGWGDEQEVEATVESGANDPCEFAGHVRPSDEPGAVPTELDCSDDAVERHATGFDEADVRWGDVFEDAAQTFALRVSDLAIERGDEVNVTLTNVSDDGRETGNRHKYNLQVYTEAGWREVRGWADGDARPYTDELVAHEPDDGFEWSFRATADGVVADHVHAEALVVCPDLPAGRYRFVVWEPTVAVAFDLVE